MNGVKNKFDFKWFIFIIIPLIIFIYCIYQNFSSSEFFSVIDFWILPLLFFICQIITYKEIVRSNKLGVWAIEIIGFVRFVIAILLYYLNENTNVYIENKLSVIMLMSFEMILIYLFIFIYLKTHKDIKENNIEYKEYSFSNLTIILLIIIYFGIIAIYPNIFMNSKSLGLSGPFGTLIKLLFNYGSIVLNILLLKFIKKLKIKKIIKIILSLIISMVFVVGFSVNGDNISRWSIVVNIIIFVDIIKSYYNSKKIINLLLLLLLFFILIIGTAFKFNSKSVGEEDIDFSFVVKKYFTFSSLDAYFSGPRQVDNAINTRKNYGKSITINTFINDIFANFPIISNFVNQSDTTPAWYNLEYYHTDIAVDKICPLIGQGYIYIWIFAPIFSVVVVWFSLIFSYKISKAGNEIEKYIYEYLAILFGIYMGSNMNIILQTIWINILPLYLIYMIKINIKR